MHVTVFFTIKSCLRVFHLGSREEIKESQKESSLRDCLNQPTRASSIGIESKVSVSAGLSMRAVSA